MGGAQAGEVASGTAVESPRAGPARRRARPRSGWRPPCATANGRIHELSRSTARGPGWARRSPRPTSARTSVTVAHVGDRRVYRLRDGMLDAAHRATTRSCRSSIDQGRLTQEEADEPSAALDHHPRARPRAERRGRDAHAPGPRRRRLPALLRRPDVDGRRAPRSRAHRARAAPSLAEAAERARRRRQRRGRPRQHHRRPVPPRGGGAPARPAPTAPTPTPRRRDEAAEPATSTADGSGRRPPRRDGRGRAHRRARPAPRAAPPPSAGDALPARRAVQASRCRPRDPRPGPRRPAGSATRAVYFVGTDSHGLVDVYRGVPYELPGGLKLYTRLLRVRRAGELAARRAGGTSCSTTRCARSDDATDLVDQLELGRRWRTVSARNRELLALIPASLLRHGRLRGHPHPERERNGGVVDNRTISNGSLTYGADLPRPVPGRAHRAAHHAARTPTRTCSRSSRCSRASGS